MRRYGNRNHRLEVLISNMHESRDNNMMAAMGYSKGTHTPSWPTTLTPLPES